LSSVAVPSHCANTVVCQGQPFTQMLLTLRWRLGWTRPRRSNQRRGQVLGLARRTLDCTDQQHDVTYANPSLTKFAGEVPSST
jgi:hypothetical protein